MNVVRLDSRGTNGEIVNGLDSFIWTERYSKSGDCKGVTTDLDLIYTLPIGSFVSHFDTLEVMRILDHEIVKEKGKTPVLTITGETLEADIMRNRIALPQHFKHGFTLPPDGVDNLYVIDENASWNQAAILIKRHVTGELPFPYSTIYGPISTNVYNGDVIPHTECVVEVDPSLIEDPLRQRIIKRGYIYDRVLELLSISSCGLKSRRPIGNNTNIQFVIFNGADVSSSVFLSAKLEDLDEATYFWSIRNLKTSSLTENEDNAFLNDVLSTGSVLSFSGIDRRWVYIGAPDVGPLNDTVLDDLEARSAEALAAGRAKQLTELKADPKVADRYGKDYTIGDIVGVFGDFGINTKMRVEEFTWTFDKNGKTGYPTLAPLAPPPL